MLRIIGAAINSVLEGFGYTHHSRHITGEITCTAGEPTYINLMLPGGNWKTRIAGWVHPTKHGPVIPAPLPPNQIIETGHDIGCRHSAELFPQHTRQRSDDD